MGVRKLLSVLLLGMMAFAVIWAVRPEWLPWERIATDVNAFEAAQSIRMGVEAETEEPPVFRFRDEGLDRQELFQTLEALWPYAFTLSTTTHRNGMLTVEVQLDNEAAQKQAAVLAQGIAQQNARPEMTLHERLRALHDYLVRNCAYDTETAEQEALVAGSGADAPFTAVGALVGGKAVCAGYSRAFMLLCDAAGIDALYISDAGMNHGWNAVRVYNEILYIDATFDDPVPDQGERVITDYFLKTEQELAKTHTWDHTFYGNVIDQALPESLGAAQRLYDLGLLPEAPRAADMAQPLGSAARAQLETKCGLTFADANETLGSAAVKAWNTIAQAGGARALIDAGVFDEVRARQVGIPENAVKNPEK